MKESPVLNPLRPTVARIDLEALRHNFALAKRLAGKEVPLLGVVKANAYGHGAVSVARVLQQAGAAALGVATPEEGIALRESGISAPILVFGGPFSASGKLLSEFRLSPVLYNVEQIRSLEASASESLPVYLKVDTGMTRLGVFPEEVPEILQAIRLAPHLELAGVMSHLAQADVTFEGPTAEQFARFSEVEKLLRSEMPEAKVFHLANSAAILGGKVGKDDWARPGILLYGSNPHPRFESGRELKPVMHFETAIVSLKEIPVGTAVSYGGTWVASRPSRIAVLPVGYADGYLRSLGNRGEVLLRGKRAPVAGRVCMDLTMIDVT
ncbi:MAG: alanine racemase, partial [Deltaproteobacteria bacterium]|nr:alanine racemase [Deltaproteobacteria bacterium]